MFFSFGKVRKTGRAICHFFDGFPKRLRYFPILSEAFPVSSDSEGYLVWLAAHITGPNNAISWLLIGNEPGIYERGRCDVAA